MSEKDKPGYGQVKKESLAATRELVAIGRERFGPEQKSKRHPEQDTFGILHRARRMGLSWEESAAMIGISMRTLERWRREHPDDFEHLDALQSSASVEVAESLLHMARGYVAKWVDEAGELKAEHVKADVRAAIFWLRSRDKWDDTPPAKEKNEIAGPIDLENMTDEQLLEYAGDTGRRVMRELSSRSTAPPPEQEVVVVKPVDDDEDDEAEAPF